VKRIDVKKALIVAAPLALACAIYACGDDDSKPPAETGPATDASNKDVHTSGDATTGSDSSTDASKTDTGTDAGQDAQDAGVDSAPCFDLVPPFDAGDGGDAGDAGIGLTAPFANDYRLQDLGTIPGLTAKALGGCMNKAGDPNKLLIAYDLETATGTIQEVSLVRGSCGHVVGFQGSPTKVANTPIIDANMAYAGGGRIIYTRYPNNDLPILEPDASAATRALSLTALGVAPSPGGMAFVPENFPHPGELRVMSYDTGNFYRIVFGSDAGVLDGGGLDSGIPGAGAILWGTLPLLNGQGGMAFVAPGSPLITNPSLIVAQYDSSEIALYELDSEGKPQSASRRVMANTEFPWGVCVDSVSGDFLFISWLDPPNHMWSIQGFKNAPTAATPIFP
jgi:hypothetical protein